METKYLAVMLKQIQNTFLNKSISLVLYIYEMIMPYS